MKTTLTGRTIIEAGQNLTSLWIKLDSGQIVFLNEMEEETVQKDMEEQIKEI